MRLNRYLFSLGFSLVFAIVLRTFFLSSYLVTSSSMSPLLLAGDHILCLKVHSSYPSLISNDVIVFRDSVSLPAFVGSSKEELLIKRIDQVNAYPFKGTGYLVVGDNPIQSIDRDEIGEVTHSNVVSWPFLCYYPLNRIGILNF